MNTQNQQTGAGNTTAAQVNPVVQDALSQWAKLVREDANLNCLQNVDHWMLVELVSMFHKLADQMPAHALSVINDEMRSLKQSIKITKASLAI